MTTDLTLDALEPALHDREVTTKQFSTATKEVSIYPFDTRIDLRKLESLCRLEVLATPTTTRWLNQSSDSTRRR
jgi:hypothetical protein